MVTCIMHFYMYVIHIRDYFGNYCIVQTGNPVLYCVQFVI